MEPGDAEVHAYYQRDEERERLNAALGVVEFERTKEIIARHLPAPPAIVADVGGGPGRYSIWLAKAGYRVHHRDLVPLHVEHAGRDAAAANVEIDTSEGDARDLDLPDASVDAVLLLGPLYHLPQQADRIAALREAKRDCSRGRLCVRGSDLSVGGTPSRRPHRAHPRGVPRGARAPRRGGTVRPASSPARRSVRGLHPSSA
jgi:SAM-dependent methyltransferase